jgi:hypothetical protein
MVLQPSDSGTTFALLTYQAAGEAFLKEQPFFKISTRRD